jgi:hypothetical protein
MDELSTSLLVAGTNPANEVDEIIVVRHGITRVT